MNILKKNKTLKMAYNAGFLAYIIGAIIMLITYMTNGLFDLPSEMLIEQLVRLLIRPILILIAVLLVKSRNPIMFILANAFIIYEFVGQITVFINNIFNLGMFSLPHLLTVVGGTVLFCSAVWGIILLIKSFIKKM